MSVDIQISNYESYLYSYVDGELNAEEAAALENFVKLHPHIRQELDMLLSTRLPPEEMIFEDKALLYRGGEIRLDNYEAYLLSYIDGELTAEEELALDRFLAQHPEIRKELVLWQATKQHADPSIVYGNKASLYRHRNAAKPRIRPAYWWTAAAAVVGVVLMLRIGNDRVEDTPATGKNLAMQQEAEPGPSTVQENIVSGSEKPATSNANTATQDKIAAVKSAASNANATAQDKVAAMKPAVSKQREMPEEPVFASAPAQQETATPARQEELSNIAGNNPAIGQEKVSAALTAIDNKIAVRAEEQKPSISEPGARAPLATPPPAQQQPGELIMSVTGNGLESKVLDKVTNVARFFSKKRNK